jgi:hypothetical protein
MQLMTEKGSNSENDALSLAERQLLHDELVAIIDDISVHLKNLKLSYSNNQKFEELLRVIHGRFSKVELNLIQLEKK